MMVTDKITADAENDVFLCYAWEDKHRADDLYHALVVAGLTVFQDERGMRDFDHIPERIDAALRSARVLLVFYTPSLPASEYCRQEMHFALLRSHHLHRRRTRVLAVVQGVDIADVRPGRLKHWRLPQPDTDPGTIATRVARHVDALRRDDPRRFGDAPDPPPVRWDPGPARDPHELYGRELELWHIHDALFPDDDAEASGRVAAVTGPAGQGTTMLAEQYARLFTADFPGGVFVRTASALLDEGTRGTRQLPAALASGRPYLWLVDDVPDDIDLREFNTLLAPTPTGRTLVTARHDLRGWVHPDRHIKLGGLGRSAALATLTCRWPPDSGESIAQRLQRLRGDRREYGTARRVVDALGGHPLALRLAAGLAGAPGFAGFGALAAMIQDPDRDALVLAEADGLDPAIAAARANTGLAEAATAHLVDAQPGEGETPSSWLFHPLVMGAVGMMHRHDPRRQLLRLAAVAVLSTRLAEGRERRCPSGELSTLLPHATAVAAMMSDIDEWHLLNEAGRVHIELGDSRAALDMYGRLHEVCRAALGDDASATLTIQVGLGTAHGMHGDHTIALRLLGDARARLTGRLGPDHPDVLTILNNIAVVRVSAGDHEAARDIYRQVHEVREKTFGPGHPDTLDALYNLGIATGRCGATQEALWIKERVYATLRSVHGDTHERTLDALSSLAATVLKLPDHDTARRLYRQVHEQRRTMPGPRAAAADAAENLAATEVDLDRIVELLTEAYRTRLDAQGPGHPRTARSLRILLVELLRHAGAAPPGSAPLSVVEEAPALPDGVQPGQIRLDDEDMGERIALLELANTYYDSQLAQFGSDATRTSVAVCYLAHALAALDQMDVQFDQAWTLIDDAAEGLEIDLGPGDPASRAADAIRRWITALGPSAEPAGTSA
jgi:tetratricopeptide (TPR) repeat protein